MENTKVQGKRREIKKIEDPGKRHVTFSKRRVGVFRKASELCALTGAECAVVCESYGGRIFAFGHPSVESVFDKYLGVRTSSELPEINSESYVNSHDKLKDQYWEISKELEIEKKKSLTVKRQQDHNFNGSDNFEKDGLFWWQQPFEHLEVEELEEFISSMEELRNKLEFKVDDLKVLKTSSSMFSANNIVNSNDCVNNTGNSNIFSANNTVNSNDCVNNTGNSCMFGANNTVNSNDCENNTGNSCMIGTNNSGNGNSNDCANNTGNSCMFGVNNTVNSNDCANNTGNSNDCANNTVNSNDSGLSDEDSENKNLIPENAGLLQDLLLNKDLDFNDEALLNELLAMNDPKFDDDGLDDILNDFYLQNNNLQLPGTNNEVQLSHVDGNLAVGDEYGKAVDLQTFDYNAVPNDFSFVSPSC